MVDEWIFIVFAIIIVAGGLSRSAGDDQEASGSFEKLNRYSNVQEQKNTYLAARFAAVLSFSDKLGLKEQGAPKQLSGPIQAKTSYANLP